MARRNRILSAFIAFAMVLAMAFSVLFIAEEANHNCSNSDCQICYQINSCLKLLYTVSYEPDVQAVSYALAFGLVLVIGAVMANQNINTLISLKTKLSN